MALWIADLTREKPRGSLRKYTPKRYLLICTLDLQMDGPGASRGPCLPATEPQHGSAISAAWKLAGAPNHALPCAKVKTRGIERWRRASRAHLGAWFALRRKRMRSPRWRTEPTRRDPVYGGSRSKGTAESRKIAKRNTGKLAKLYAVLVRVEPTKSRWFGTCPRIQHGHGWDGRRTGCADEWAHAVRERDRRGPAVGGWDEGGGEGSRAARAGLLGRGEKGVGRVGGKKRGRGVLGCGVLGWGLFPFLYFIFQNLS